VIGGFHGFEKLELLREFHLIMPCHGTAQRKEIVKRYPSKVLNMNKFPVSSARQ